MCELCFRLILANHTDPVTGIFTGLDLSLASTENKRETTPSQRGSSEPESSSFDSAEPPRGQPGAAR
jgi:hypothetical protein